MIFDLRRWAAIAAYHKSCHNTQVRQRTAQLVGHVHFA